MEVFLARQAIFDRNRRLHAYELLYRACGQRNEFDGTNAHAATMQVIANILLSMGSQDILCGKKAFLNFDHDLLSEGVYLGLPPDKIVIEVLESVTPTADLIALCRSIQSQGYTIALDDFVPQLEPLACIASLIKVDTRSTSRPEQQRLLKTYRPRGIQMLAEKVETQEEFQWALQAGYDLFQGYFFARPVIMSGRQIPAAQASCLNLLRETRRPDLNFRRLEELIRCDVSLTFKLLRYINSALFGRRDRVSSIASALVVLGEDGIRRWIALATLPMLATTKPGELITLSIVRARFCERLAQLLNIPHQDRAFVMGMFSLLDALTDRPLEEALREIHLEPPITEALLGTAPAQETLSNIYSLARRYERGEWDELEEGARRCGVPPAAVRAAYVESTLWAQSLMGRGEI